jgi:hypothetical protein
MALEIVFSPLALAPKTFYPGDTIRVTASFKYTVGADTSVTVEAGPYQYKLGILDRIGSCFGMTTVALPKAPAPVEKQFTVDFKLQDIQPGTYGLLIEIPGTEFSTRQDNVLIVGGAPWLGLLTAAMMMGMLVPLLEKEEV